MLRIHSKIVQLERLSRSRGFLGTTLFSIRTIKVNKKIGNGESPFHLTKDFFNYKHEIKIPTIDKSPDLTRSFVFDL